MGRDVSNRARFRGRRLAAVAAMGLVVAGSVLVARPVAHAAPQGEDPVLTGAAVARAGEKVTRREVIDRAKTWLTAHNGGPVPYNQNAHHDGYRADCSGFVSMAWKLDRPGLTTVTLPNVADLIDKNDLRPGDVLMNGGPGTGGDNGHVVIFEKWVDTAKTRYLGIEQAGYPANGTVYREISYPYGGDARFKPYRYRNIVDNRSGAVGTDVSGDGFADVLATTRDGKLWYYPNNIKSPGNNGLPFVSGYSVSFDNSRWHTHQRVVAGDVNGDGRADLLATSSDGTLWLYQNKLSGNDHPFDSAINVGGPNWTEDKFRLVAASDVTGDGYADALAVDADGKLWYFPNNINGSDKKPFGGGVAIGGDWRGFTRIMAADVSGDGYADILATDANGHLWYYVNGIIKNNGIPFTSGADVGSGWNWMNNVVLGDYNGDGRADIVATDPDGKLWFYPNSGAGDNPFPTRVVTPGSDWRGYDRIL